MNSGNNYDRHHSGLRAKTIPYSNQPQFKSSFYNGIEEREEKESPRIAVEAVGNSRQLKISDQYEEQQQEYNHM